MLVDAEPCTEDDEHPVEAPAAQEEVDEVERARQREIAAYLSAASFPLDLPGGSDHKPFINADPTINALCQLGALRLNCDRSFISLIDRNYQWVVAEMTRSHSIREMKWDADDRIFLGVARLDACWGVCPTTMKAFLDDTGAWVRHGPNVIANNTRYIVNDFRTDPAYSARPYVVNFPYFRSYLEVPLVSPLGYLLGSYCVVHNELKEYDNDETVGIMNDIAASIMVYLDDVRLRQNRNRSDQLITGLNNYIASDTSTTASMSSSPPSIVPARPSAPERASSLSIPEKGASSVSDSTSSRNPARPPQLPNIASASSIESSISGPSLTGVAQTAGTPMTSLASDSQSGFAEPSAAPPSANQDAEIAPNTPVSASSDIPEQQSSGFLSSANIKSAFFRAAQTIRQSMKMDGLVFLDAAPTAYVSHAEDTAAGPERGPEHGPFCATIVQSLVDQDGESTPRPALNQLPEATLQRLIKRFPNGHIFSADEFGPIDESYAPGMQFPGLRAEHKSRRLRADVGKLFEVLPAAKYVFLVPLWHPQRECWYAATLGWVTDPTNAIEVSDLGLLAAFGNSVMAEVTRIEALAANRARSSFISSISHELRSPLHGILASSELLRASISEPTLLSTLDMLDSCGRTLLDTFNNLLEHAITIKDSQVSTAPAIKLEMLDLSALVQEVVEAVHFSYLSEKKLQSSLTVVEKGNQGYSGMRSADKAGRPLLILLEIEKRDWRVRADAGTWKRFVMNIFGNALKYTKTGRIEVSLQMVQRADGSPQACLKVEDTGCGMTADYMKYRLWQPFAQENPFAPGIGLGLCICQQLARSLGGTIDVKSSVGIGTLVQVRLPLPEEEPVAAAITGMEMVSVSPGAVDDHKLQGLTMCLVTSEAYRYMTQGLAPREKRKSKSSVAFEHAIRANACGAKVLLASQATPLPKADVYILDSESFRDVIQKGSPSDVAIPSVSPLLFLCSGSGSPLCLSCDAIKNHGRHLHHPIGPKKLVSAVLSAIEAAVPQLPPSSLDTTTPISPLQVLASPPVLEESSLPPQLNPPSSAPPPETKPPAEAEPPAPLLSLLLVDDNPINIKLLATTVRRLNHNFQTASDGLEAVRLYQKALDNNKPFDMVWMDLQMPVMDGFEAIRRIRDIETEVGMGSGSGSGAGMGARARKEGAMIIALTGLSSEVNKMKAMASGSNLFMTKPVKLGGIKKLLEEQVRKKIGEGGGS